MSKQFLPSQLVSCLLLVASAAALLPAQILYTISTFAGGGLQNGVQGREFALNQPNALAIDNAGNVYIPSWYGIYRLSPQGIVTLFAGTGKLVGPGPVASGIAANNAAVFASSLAMDNAGNLYFAQPVSQGQAGAVRRIDARSGIISTVVGSGAIPGTCGDPSDDGGLAINAKICASYVALDSAGNVYITEDQRIRKVNSGTGILTTVAGNGKFGFSGDGGPATDAQLGNPRGIALDASGNLYIADSANLRVRRVDAVTGMITTFAGNGRYGNSGDGGLSINAELIPGNVRGDASGNVYVSGGNAIRKVVIGTGIITTVAGTSGTCSADSVLDATGNVFIADECGNRVVKVTASTGLATTVAGTGECCFSGDGGAATDAKITPWGGAVDRRGNVYIADRSNHRVRKVAAGTGIIPTIAGPTSPSASYGKYGGFGGDGGPAISASMNSPSAIAIDSKGNIFIADTYNHRIRKIDAQTRSYRRLLGQEKFPVRLSEAIRAVLVGTVVLPQARSWERLAA